MKEVERVLARPVSWICKHARQNNALAVRLLPAASHPSCLTDLCDAVGVVPQLLSASTDAVSSEITDAGGVLDRNSAPTVE